MEIKDIKAVYFVGAGGIGMSLFDLISGWTAWAPFTLVIVAAMGYVSGLISEKPFATFPQGFPKELIDKFIEVFR